MTRYSDLVLRYLVLRCAESTGIPMPTIISSVNNENFAYFPTIIDFISFIFIILTLYLFPWPAEYYKFRPELHIRHRPQILISMGDAFPQLRN